MFSRTPPVPLFALGCGCALLLASAFAPAAEIPKIVSLEESQADYQTRVAPFLKQHCEACHGPKKEEGELNLVALEADMKQTASGARWAVVLQKLVAREMPPEDRPRPDDASVKVVVTWIQAEMKRSGKRVAHRAAYANGNVVAHDLLFDPKQAAAFDVPARVRRPSPEVYEAFLAEVAKGTNGLGQPFSPEGKTTFKDMGAPKIDEPITAQLIQNALAIVEKQTAHKIEGDQVKGIGQLPKEFAVLFDPKQPPTDAQMQAAIRAQFDRVLRRPPTDGELGRFVGLMQKNISDAGRTAGVRYALAAVFLLPEAIFRWEVGAGPIDEQGRVRLAPREIAFVLSYALTDKRPDSKLLAEAEQGKLATQEQVEAAVRRMLDDPKLEKPRILRFFREYFGYDKALDVFKDDKQHPDHDARALVEDTDRLVLYILEQDKNVFRELLTTNKSFVAHKSAAETKKRRADEIAKFEKEKAANPEKFKTKKPPKSGRSVYEAYNLADFPDQQPVELPASERSGILTQPSWLVAWSQSENNHAILRGKWVRERLLGGVVPDIPITVDAQLPIAPEKTLRERMGVTQQEYCWKCHQLMNPVGLPFEMYDHVGRFRTEEVGKPVDASGGVTLFGEAKSEGDVRNAVEMLRRLAESERAEQTFVRHVFRYFTGRNESLGDAASLQAAHKAYTQGGGSMKALIASILSSDSFLYRVSSEKSEKK